MFQQKLLAGIARRPGALDSSLLSSTFNNPHSITQISKQQFVVSDTNNDSLRLIDVLSNTVSTVDTTSPHCAVQNILQKPRGIWYSDNNIFIADSGNSKIRLLNGESGYTTNFAGNSVGYEDCATQKSRFDRPASVVVSHIDGTIFIADTYNHCIRYIRRGCDLVETLVGTPGKPGYIDKIDELKGKPAQFNCPVQILVLKTGNLLVADVCNNAIRHIHVGARLVTTIVGMSKNLYYHCNTKFTLNEKFDCRSFNEEQRYHVYTDYQNDPQKQIIQSSQLVKNPESIIQMPDNSLLIGCNKQLFRITPECDQILPITELSVGRITGMTYDTFTNNVYAVDAEINVVWELSFKDYDNLSGVEKSVKSKNRLNQEKLNQTADVSKTLIQKTNANSLVDFQRYSQIVASFPEFSSRFDLAKLAKLALFMSCTKPAWEVGDKEMLLYSQLFVNEIIGKSEFVKTFLQLNTNRQILQTLSQAINKNQIAASLQLFDVDLINQFVIQKPQQKEYFVGNYAEAVNIKANFCMCVDVLACGDGKIFYRVFDEVGNMIVENQAREILDSPLFGDRYKVIYGDVDIQTIVYNSSIIQVIEDIVDERILAVQDSVVQSSAMNHNILNASNWFSTKFLVDCYELGKNGAEKLLSGRVEITFEFVMTEIKLSSGGNQFKVLLQIAHE